MHYTELYIFALDLYLNSLNHFIWKRLKVTVCGRDKQTDIFYDPDPVLILSNSVQIQPQSKRFFKCKVQVQMKSKKFEKCSFFTTKIPHFFSINSVPIWS